MIIRYVNNKILKELIFLLLLIRTLGSNRRLLFVNFNFNRIEHIGLNWI